MYFINALTYPFYGDRSLVVAVVFGVLLTIPLVNLLALVVLLGYASRMVPLVYQGIIDKPQFDFAGDFGRGIVLLVAIIAYNLVSVILTIVLLIAVGENTAALAVAIVAIVLLFMFTNLGFIVGFIRYSLEGAKADMLLDVVTNYRLAITRIDATLVFIFNLIIFSIIAGIGINIGFVFLICPGVFLLGAWQGIGNMHLYISYGQALGLYPSKPLPDPNRDDFTGDLGGFQI
jgi:hypothetical protein